jgi:serine/threonine protein kinase/Tfp pilus assembly protein PilF
MIPESISHYRITRKLGAGGMGEVYLAEDTRLGREVALKILPASYQYDPDRRGRFLAEARAASALRSPNIAAIYDIGEHQGAMFIVMEYVDGDSLLHRINTGPIPADQIVDIAMQVAEALIDAHQMGIVHRDIKSTNLMVTSRGLVKMLDFGLAKVVTPSPSQDSDQLTVAIGAQTAPGMVLGTISNMSPEQALGRDIDHRSDIFSLGIVLYEMMTGRLPFEGASETEIIDKIIHEEPAAVSRFNYEVPDELERIMRKCIQKERDRRYQSALELATDLRNLKRDTDSEIRRRTRSSGKSRVGKSRKAIESLAILPLINDSDNPDLEYLSDGITESIINSLSQLPKLRVMARSTVFRYKHQSTSPLEGAGEPPDPVRVGTELGVQAVMTGRVGLRNDQLVIRTELVDTADGALIWGEHYSRTLSAIFALEEEISHEISSKLRVKLTGAQKKKLVRRYTENTEAYQLYLKGRFYWNKRTEDGLCKAVDFFQQAISSDPSYALAYSGLADCYNILASYSAMRPSEAFRNAKAAASRALELDPKLAEAYTSMAFVTMGYDWDWVTAENNFKRAIEICSGHANAHHWYALLLAALGRLEEAFAEIEKARQLDPLSLPINTNVGWILALSRRYEEAVEQLQKTIDLDSSFGLAHRRLGQVYEHMGRPQDTIVEFQKSLHLSGQDSELLAARGHFLGITGDRAQAESVLRELEELSARQYVPAFFFAKVYIGLGDLDHAFKFLDRAYDERYGLLGYMNVEPIFDPLRQDPRFAELARRVGLR